MIRKLFVVLGTLGVLFLGFAIVAVMGALAPKPERREAPQRVPTAYVQDAAYAPVQLKVYAQGEVRPRREIALTPQVSGRIIEVSESFVDGGVISQGDVLVRLEDADYRSAVTRARARVAEARQALAVEEAESALAARDYRELAGDDADPSALALRRPQLARAEASLAAAQADLADAELSLARTRIVAPFDGRVRSISANIGQAVSPGTPVGQIFSTDTAEVRLPLTDADLARLKLPFAFEAPYGEGPEVIFSADAAGATRTWTGHIVRTDAAIDPSTRQISAIARLEDPYGAGADMSGVGEGEAGFPMAIGLFVAAEIEGPTLERAVVLPRLALDEGGVVYTLAEDDTVERREVSVAAITGEGVVITDGIAAGDRVVVSRLPTAVGRKVRPLRPGEEATPPAQEEEDAEESDDGAQAEASEGRRRRRGGRGGTSGAGR